MLPTDKYIKIVYESSPIGVERIVLYLTTFDLKRYERDKKLEEKRFAQRIELNNAIAPTYNDLYNNGVSNMLRANQQALYGKYLEEYCNALIKRYYEPYVKEAIDIIDTYKDKITTPKEFTSTKKIENVVNSDKVECDIIYGNVTNCDEVHCREIRGNVVNCDIYKE